MCRTARNARLGLGALKTDFLHSYQGLSFRFVRNLRSSVIYASACLCTEPTSKQFWLPALLRGYLPRWSILHMEGMAWLDVKYAIVMKQSMLTVQTLVSRDKYTHTPPPPPPPPETQLEDGKTRTFSSCAFLKRHSSLSWSLCLLVSPTFGGLQRNTSYVSRRCCGLAMHYLAMPWFPYVCSSRTYTAVRD